MRPCELLLISVGLAMDAFAVSVVSGFTVKRLRVYHAFRMALFFGVFQGVMPVIGWLAGLSWRAYIAHVDHWIAFGLLLFVGGKMIYESLVMDEKDSPADVTNILVLLTLSVATSIDALAVGLTLSMLNVEILWPSLAISVVTFMLSLAGFWVGTRFGHFFERKIEIVGGLVLIAIGAKILLEHLTQ